MGTEARIQRHIDIGLRSLGMTGNRQRRRLASMIELVEVGAGRLLVKAGDLLPAVVVGLTGTALLWDGSRRRRRVVERFVLDEWAVDERGRATVSLEATSDMQLLLVDHRNRHEVYDAVPLLETIARATETALLASPSSERRARDPWTPSIGRVVAVVGRRPA